MIFFSICQNSPHQQIFEIFETVFSMTMWMLEINNGTVIFVSDPLSEKLTVFSI